MSPIFFTVTVIFLFISLRVTQPVVTSFYISLHISSFLAAENQGPPTNFVLSLTNFREVRTFVCIEAVLFVLDTETVSPLSALIFNECLCFPKRPKKQSKLSFVEENTNKLTLNHPQTRRGLTRVGSSNELCSYIT